jgi:hypothetical protein
MAAKCVKNRSSKEHVMFVEIIDGVTVTPLGEEIESISMGLLLNINGEEIGVPVRDLTDIYLDTEEISTATKLFVTYQNNEYEFGVPDQSSVDWQFLEDLINPE